MNINQNIPEILNKYNHIAVVGLSSKFHRPSYGVAAYLQRQGYQIYPVNPNCKDVLGRKCYKNLDDIGHSIEIVNIFRRSEKVMPIVDEAIKTGAKVIWMQQGIVNETAAQKALQAGLYVVMDLCLKIEHAMIR